MLWWPQGSRSRPLPSLISANARVNWMVFLNQSHPARRLLKKGVVMLIMHAHAIRGEISRLFHVDPLLTPMAVSVHPCWPLVFARLI